MEYTEETLDSAIKTKVAASQGKENLPNHGGILTMGILSIVFAGLIGLILGIISLSLSGKAISEYKANPDKYTESSYKNVKAGKVCAIIGISLLGFVIVIIALLAASGAL